MARKPVGKVQEEDLELVPDAWERFEAMTRKVMGAKVDKTKAPTQPRSSGHEHVHGDGDRDRSNND